MCVIECCQFHVLIVGPAHACFVHVYPVYMCMCIFREGCGLRHKHVSIHKFLAHTVMRLQGENLGI
jgi:hypothetical protein